MSRSYELRLIHIADMEVERKVIDGVRYIRLAFDIDVSGLLRPPLKVRLCEEDRAFIEEWQRTHSEEDGHIIKDEARAWITRCSPFCANFPLIVEYHHFNNWNTGARMGTMYMTKCREHSHEKQEAKRQAARRHRGWKELGISITGGTRE